ncbi:MAG: glucose-1-phosphate cytidylyltransferase [Candidatus Levybacteria bacterium]|nr:glucose-1-phosphate cytidylyltransferase [Candidatus Levybacteria bacterium]
MNIPIVIFCGGQGTRMKEETEFRPKPMVLVGEKPILWHIMKIYSHYGFNNFIIALGYKGDYIKSYFLNEEYLIHDFTIKVKTGRKIIYRRSVEKHENFKITFVNTGLETLTGERLLRVKKYIKSDIFMATYGDGIGNINILKLLSYFKSKKTVGAITGVHPKSKWGLVIADKDGIIKNFVQKPLLNQYVNGGFMVFKKSFLKYVKPEETIEIALERLVKIRQLAVYAHNGYWSAVDTYQDLEELNKQWVDNPVWKIW